MDVHSPAAVCTAPPRLCSPADTPGGHDSIGTYLEPLIADKQLTVPGMLRTQR